MRSSKSAAHRLGAARALALVLAALPAIGTGQEPRLLRCALLTPGRENDGGWNQLAYEAARALEGEGGIRLSHTHAPNATAFTSDLRDYAQQGCDLVICHGGEYVKAARQIARRFPQARIVVTGSAEGGDGIATLDFQLWQASYLCGVLAARLEPDGPAGLIGAQNFKTVKNTLDAFVHGLRSVRPDYPVFYQYTGSWDDVAKARQTARSLIETYRVRVIFQNTDAAAAGVFDAARSAQPAVYAFGCNSAQHSLAPDVVPASAVIDVQRAFRELADAVRAGRFEARNYAHTLATGGVTVTLNPAFESRWPAGTMELFERARSEIVAGRLDVLREPDR